MLYEIINPSDPYTIEAQSLDVAAVACLFLGRRQYAFDPIGSDDSPEVPLFLFGGTDEWCLKHFNESFESVVNRVTKEKAAELAECLESCLIGKAADRETYRAGMELIDDPKKREQWREKWLEDRRSSMNNIGARAYAIAEKLRAGAKNPLVEAPQQVFAV
jgi:hypothetical protein